MMFVETPEFVKLTCKWSYFCCIFTYIHCIMILSYKKVTVPPHSTIKTKDLKTLRLYYDIHACYYDIITIFIHQFGQLLQNLFRVYYLFFQYLHLDNTPFQKGDHPLLSIAFQL